jgi:uncharacterized small protein (DUF1192 family)
MANIIKNADKFVEAEFNPALSDRFVNYGVFIPKKIPQKSKFLDFFKKVLNPKQYAAFFSELANAVSGFKGRQAAALKALLAKHNTGTLEDLKSIVKEIKDILGKTAFDIGSAQILGVINRIEKELQNYRVPLSGDDAAEAELTSEIGYLFLDRTRLTPSGFAVGELLHTISLEPGAELTTETKITRKELTTIENTIEREFETSLEFSSEASSGTQITDSTGTSSSKTDTSSVNADVGGSFESTGVPVEAGVGAQAGSTIQNAVNSANTTSSSLSRTTSSKVATKLRKNHKTTIETSVENIFENSQKRFIKNPNEATPVTYLYFKVMQKIRSQVQRKGLRLCWAPFVYSPGFWIKKRMEDAKAGVYKAALESVTFPPTPPPPLSQLQPVIKKGTPATYNFTGFPFEDDSISLTCRTAKGDIWTNRFFVQQLDELPFNAFAGGPLNKLVHIDGSEGGSKIRKIKDDFIYTQFLSSNGFSIGSCRFRLDVEVIPENKNYKKELLAYLQSLNEYYKSASEIINGIIGEFHDRAEAAAQDVLNRVDIRSELLRHISAQYLVQDGINGGHNVELWSRIIEFENIGYKFYPGWWTNKSQFPALPDDHILNASWARVFLPIAKSYEEFAVKEIFGSKAYNSLNGANFFTSLRSEQDKFLGADGVEDYSDINKEWTLSVPTDGVHAECLLGATSALDDTSIKEIQQRINRTEMEIEKLKAEVGIKTNIPSNAAVNIDA